ncbi:BatD family protein [Pseudobdellovibrio exovorus]|uniref:Protein BatD n=1 Tax=Pseudobdellovibrio exovorus JSS TaxID=1184267 RepID=M4V9I7_9BACT|nr:BatD family protein [Pseudobdellovibrio exovorus]AGH95105.1 hypothetical protein A11Q_889 [Pseudobdellovibrio exovorus JSS]
MRKIGNWISTLLVLLFICPVWAANITVTSTVDRNQMGIGDSFGLTVTVQGDEDFEVDAPQLPHVAGLELINTSLGGRQSSSSMSIINGRAQFQKQVVQTYHFLMSPQKEGSFLIPAIEVLVNGKVYHTNSIKIDVAEEYRNGQATGSAGAEPRFPPGYGGSGVAEDIPTNPFGQDVEDLFDQLLRQQQRMFGGGGGGGAQRGNPSGQIPSRQLNVDTNEVFFVYLDVDKTEVYEGEQITANWYIYTRANIEALDRVKFPDLKGFWKEIIEEVPSLQFSEEIVNGVRYRKALLASHALFPINASGVSVIDEFRVKAKVRLPTQFGWGQPTDINRASRRVQIKVLPLPTEGRTQSFSGAVGQYRVSLRTEGVSFPAHQPFSIKVRYEGIGNAKLIDLPTINWPAGLEVYDTKSDAKFFREGNSYKEFEVLVIPRREGEMKIPSLEFTYFDPQKKQYVSEATSELNLMITKGVAGAGIPSSGTLQSNTDGSEYKAQAILELPKAQAFSSSLARPLVYALATLTGLVVMLIEFFRRLRGLGKAPDWTEKVSQKLKLIDQYASTNDHRRLGSESVNLIYMLVGYLTGQEKTDREFHLLIDDISVQDQKLYLSRVTQLFDYFQLVGFSPEEILKDTLNRTPVAEQVKALKILAKEIVAKSSKEDR